jgi:hypothetical protein
MAEEGGRESNHTLRLCPSLEGCLIFQYQEGRIKIPISIVTCPPPHFSVDLLGVISPTANQALKILNGEF